jgi:3-oxoacyl-[acyl-carrier-protein] synthase-3
MRHTALAGSGSFLPGEPLTNEMVEGLFGTDDGYLSALLGTKYRYWATNPRTFELRYHNSDLAAEAAKSALEAAGMSPSEVQLLIVNSCTPDYLMPPMGPLVQEKLGIAECAALEMRSGCAGSIAAIAVASQFINSGTYDTALVIASELASSQIVMPLREKRELTMDERLNGIMFGDGAGAVVLRGSDNGAAGVEKTCLNSIGCGKPPGMMTVAGGSTHPFGTEASADGTTVFRHDRRAILKWGLPMCVRAIEDICTATGLGLGDVDCFIFPQANPSMIAQDRKAADTRNLIPEDRIVVNVDKVGNTVSAGILIAFDGALREGRISKGDRVALIGTEASKWLYGAALIRI